ncbi:2136_t:CDS:2 [Scutellospora calospora]|uniref:2136_t:CDS:1 n=1 Tax=Scutellospora calospora TaxID=85575 RepID=A0ACA9KUK1_9GLOM|nr:2136_t:CDS:2 [Scutellospora calospora]
MAFQSMINGTECSGSNPLTGILKQFTDDKSIQKDGFFQGVERAGSSSFRTLGPNVKLQDQKLIGEFFDQQDHSITYHVPEFVDHRAQDWTSEFQNVRDVPQTWKFGPLEEAEMEYAFKRMNFNDNWNAEFIQNSESNTTHLREIPPEFEAAFQKNFDWASEYVLNQDKGKGKEKIVELDSSTWEEQFEAAQRDAEHKQKSADDRALFNEFENIWSQVQDNSDEWDNFFNNRVVDLGDYVFEEDSPYLHHEDPFQEGLRLAEMGGTLSQIALAFEAAVRKDNNNSEAWMWLGNTQAQNEKELAAIRALQKAVEVDGGNLPALMSLAVSYTNEGYDEQAYLTLERWITAKYPNVVTRAAPMHNVISIHSRVTELFIQAAREAPEGEGMDPDVQVGLGVLFYGSGKFDKADYLLWNRLGATLANSGQSEDAIEAYRKALDLKPNFVRARYNLGVSCLNIGCYREAAEHLLGALSMHQTGLDNENIKNASDSLRETLFKTFNMMDRDDLCKKLTASINVDQFRDEFEF